MRTVCDCHARGRGRLSLTALVLHAHGWDTAIIEVYYNIYTYVLLASSLLCIYSDINNLHIKLHYSVLLKEKKCETPQDF